MIKGKIMGVRKFFTKKYGSSKFFMFKILGSEFFPGENMGVRNFFREISEHIFFNQSGMANQFCKRIALYDGGEL